MIRCWSLTKDQTISTIRILETTNNIDENIRLVSLLTITTDVRSLILDEWMRRCVSDQRNPEGEQTDDNQHLLHSLTSIEPSDQTSEKAKIDIGGRDLVWQFESTYHGGWSACSTKS